jgi:putative salt-induced outer membrane protein YdiY
VSRTLCVATKGITVTIRSCGWASAPWARSVSASVAVLTISLIVVGTAGADEVLFLNGDRLTGKIVGATGGKLTIKTESIGEVTVDLAKVKTLSTDEPVVIKAGDATLKSKVTGGSDGTVQIVPLPGAPLQVISLAEVTQINPPPVKWTGSATFNAMLTRGNSDTTNIGASLNAVRRSEDDRITLGAGYYYGRERNNNTGQSNTTVDNWFGLAEYNYFLTKKFYGLGSIRIEQDQIADLELRVIPSLGVGYQWYETPTFNLNTEAGVAWVYEKFEDEDSRDRFAARIAYHVDWTPYKGVKLFHNLAWLPSFDGPFDDFLLDLDAGLRATIIEGFFAEMKVVLRYNSSPAPGTEKSDVRYLFGVGWAF